MSLPESTLDPQALKMGMTPELCAQVVRQHGGMVLGACRRILRDDSLAQDAAQETFLLLIQKARHIPAQASLAGWLYQAACRISQNHQRTLVRRQQREAAFVTTSLMDAPTDAPWQELEPQLDAAMLTLPERQRDLVVQCYFQQQSQRQAALHLGLSESVVSRELARAIESLRSFFKKRGLGISATSLIALLSAHAVEAATLSTASLSSLSSLLSAAKQAAASTAAPGLLGLGTLAALKAPLALGLLALLAGLTSYDLASERSFLSEWWTSATEPTAGQKLATMQAQTTLANAPNKEQLLAEARDIWAKARQVDLKLFGDNLDLFSRDMDLDKVFARLHAMGMTISRSAFDDIIESIGKDKGIHERKGLLWQQVIKKWCHESPREAFAWMYMITHATGDKFDEVDRFISLSAHTFSRHPAAWAAFWEMSPDPRLEGHASLWQQELLDPGVIWTLAKENKVSHEAVKNYLERMIEEGDVESALQLVTRCPDLTLKKNAILGLTERLDAGTLRRLAHETFLDDAALSNLLLAISGDTDASFDRAVHYLQGITKNNDHNFQGRTWAEMSRKTLYAQWLKQDVGIALQDAIKVDSVLSLSSYMKDSVRAGHINEETVLHALSGATAKDRDRALAAFYLEEAGGDPFMALQRMMNSASIEDQVESAKPALSLWSQRDPDAAAAWLKSLPRSEGYAELAALIAGEWSGLDPAKSLAFIHEQGIGLKHGLVETLPQKWIGLSEESLISMIQTFRQEPEYDELVVTYALYRSASHPESGIKFIQMLAQGHWQTLFVERMTHWIKTDDARLEDYQPMLPKVDLSEVPPHKMKALNEALANQRGKADSKP